VRFRMALFATLLASPSLWAQQPPPGYEQPPVYVPPPPPTYYPPPYYAPPPPPPRYRPVRRVYVVRRPGFDPYYPRRVRGLLGASGLGTFVLGQSGGVEYLRHGGGFSIFGGIDLGHVVGFELSYTGSFHNPTAVGCDQISGICGANYLVLELLTASIRLRIPTWSRVWPYFQLGGAIAWIGRQSAIADATGGGFEAGFGLDIWASRYFTLGPRVLYRGLRMSDYGTYTGTDTFLSLLTVDFNLAVRF
jgi:hypothetical protein